jgi:Outer membrane protein beta-barrel domain
MRFYRSILGGLVLICAIHASAFAQTTSCEDQLGAATAEFEAGRFYGIPSMLKPCIDNGFTREQRQRAFLLLTQAYLLLDDPIGADNSYLEVLRANPEFLADTARDQIDLVYLSKRFTADPIFSLSGRIGGNFSPVRVIQEINPSGGAAKNDYKFRVGFQAAIGLDWHISGRAAITGEINYVFTSYMKNQLKWAGDLEEFIDKQSWVSFPIGAKYTLLTRGKIRPFVFGGYSVNLLISDQAQVRTLKNDGDITLDESLPEESYYAYRRKINSSIFIGGGAKYKVGLNYLFAEMRYNFGLTNVVIPSTTFDGPAQRSGHVDDYFRLDNFSISVGYVRPLYKPRMVKRAKTKSVLKDIKRQAK